MPHLFGSPFSSHQQASIAILSLVLGTSVAWLALRRERLSPEAAEQARREWLAATGRITDGSLVDTATVDGPVRHDTFAGGNSRDVPRLLLFQYRIAGVAYEAAQDVSSLSEQVTNVRIDQPVQVRYDHQNPSNSIVVAESWNGLRRDHAEG